MPNPLKDWTHGKKKEEEVRVSIPLQRAPEWIEEASQWRALLSKKILDPKVGLPSLKGKFFYWDGTLYEAVSQEVIADQKLLRDLKAKYDWNEVRVFFWLYLDEIDSRLALTLGRRRRDS